jgi:hypothetical protein
VAKGNCHLRICDGSAFDVEWRGFGPQCGLKREELGHGKSEI